MKHEMKKVSKIIDEMTTYGLKNGAEDIEIKIKNTPDYFKLQFVFKKIHISASDYGELIKALKVPRQMEIEEYCWELAGENDLDLGTNLIGTMTDEVKIEQEEDSLMIELFRYKN